MRPRDDETALRLRNAACAVASRSLSGTSRVRFMRRASFMPCALPNRITQKAAKRARKASTTEYSMASMRRILIAKRAVRVRDE